MKRESYIAYKPRSRDKKKNERKNANKHEKKVDRTQESSKSTGSQHHATYSLTSSIADIIIITSVMHNSITDKDIVIIIIIFVGEKRQFPTTSLVQIKEKNEKKIF